MGRRKSVPDGEFVAEILDLDHEGRGIARIQGKATFIADALPGERVRFKYRRIGKDADEGQCVGLEQASPYRVTPVCAHFGRCGGCSMQHLAPEQQILFKQKQLLDQLARIGKVVPSEIAAPLTGPIWGYRRRARLGVKFVPKKGGVLVGFRERESHFLAALETCPVLDPRIGSKLRQLGELIGQMSIRDRIPQVEVACAETVALVFRVLAPPSASDRARLTEFGVREGFDIYLQPAGIDSIEPLVSPTPALEYSPDGSDLRLRFAPCDFIQVNGVISQRMVVQALDWLGIASQDRVLELFCGLGNFSLPLARRGARLTAVEGDDALVCRARENARRNGLDIRFEKADLFNTSADAVWLQPAFDKVLLDPPRAGAREILPLVAARGPARIVYVSCHPGTLARDAGILVHEYGYRLVRVGVMDMFPHTGHVESMALFERAA
ncbi:23S rRNA m(5)U-1939 methyltransferase [Fontimonas thermophila]|uniref:23S rRNA (uracil(1939)-C(5))-methyltransferase RlmD n=1 Tax=Fontimonas thermophila TaxID=1076937 RepID=A0A1I2K6V8_9GAMM|nr:23S rRNA (uracil(1939)-C(5))-methyltransferase RlmD [Fontimonas thermophila]SFF61930.1 23S rRNA m(5)U-1939 methyltransferase [Fontimonas thermophila]